MKQMVNPWKTYVNLSAVLMGSHGLTKGSLAFLNYPAQLMFKSTKMISAYFVEILAMRFNDDVLSKAFSRYPSFNMFSYYLCNSSLHIAVFIS
ncbi:uncharacterized protein A4U43_C05F21270 [Asparagus officinalis]|uniref:Uncharacterized protein n=1 Tax=Asparagus officinalis TaxID=4686 RepID=A0A5P1EVU3_ASPOF|nr:uncharacterized protein A4U43_C05F21270 [Asparagus officinalis]